MMAHSQKPRRRRTLLLVVVQVIVTLLLFEVTLRLLRHVNGTLDSLLYLPTISTNLSEVENTAELVTKYHKSLAPAKIVRGFALNSRCLRTHEYVYERSGGLRIVAIGDSFTWGAVPHRDTWPVQLQAQLQQALQRQDVEVISLGVPAVGPQFYLRMWELEGRRLQPDLVIVGFFIGNDLTDEARRKTRLTQSNWLVENSLTVRAIRNVSRLLAAGVATEEEDNRANRLRTDKPPVVGVEVPELADSFDPSKPKFKESSFMRIEWNRMRLCLQSNRKDALSLLRKVQPVLEELDHSVRASGADMIVFLIPDEYQIDDDLSRKLLEAHDMDRSDFNREVPQRRLVKFFEQSGIHYIDGLRKFRSRSKTEQLYLPLNTHWNAGGNKLAAEMMVDYLQGSELLQVVADGS